RRRVAIGVRLPGRPRTRHLLEHRVPFVEPGGYERSRPRDLLEQVVSQLMSRRVYGDVTHVAPDKEDALGRRIVEATVLGKLRGFEGGSLRNRPNPDLG